MSELFRGFEQLLELAKALEDKLEKGEIKADVQINTRPLSSIPRQGNIPRGASRVGSGDNIGRSNIGRSSIPPDSVQPPVAKENTQASDQTNSETGSSVSLQDVGGLAGVLKELRELVEIPLKRPELLAKLGLEPPRGILLVGPPGTGKTLTARALAAELGVNYIALVGPEVMGKYYGEAEARLRSIFEKATRSAPCLIFIDEIDSLAPDRAKVEGEVEKRLVAQLLSLMDGFAQMQGVIVLAATNRLDHLDPALRRPGRLDREVQFRVPDRDGRLEILQIQTRTMPLDESVDLTAVADLAVGMVGADLKAVCQKAAYLALRRQVPDLQTVPDTLTLTQADFLQALKDVKPSVLRSVEIESPQVSWEEIGGLEF
ncbi:AAA family ATPase [Leptolyngbya sp. 7M]|uniref:AAA family ATPase n=1 Tax=Leptolyngbya sp. 7M TaxID=2812896 RepID=UPI001B8B9B53|nr:AAA family ATPase [Leptolyngbya sp. 7M]QYO63059.1 AAA family ATPase [Leptolyngbya sp. 7M]